MWSGVFPWGVVRRTLSGTAFGRETRLTTPHLLSYLLSALTPDVRLTYGSPAAAPHATRDGGR